MAQLGSVGTLSEESPQAAASPRGRPLREDYSCVDWKTARAGTHSEKKKRHCGEAEGQKVFESRGEEEKIK
jgi:hypothetical protein